MNGELPVSSAIKAYPFNSQVLSLDDGGDGTMCIIAPEDAREDPHAKQFLDRVLAEENPVKAIHYLDVRQSMNNGGGPACLRLRVGLEDTELAALGANVRLTDGLYASLAAWIERHYRDRLDAADL